ncbi:LysR family transcriptional regulator [Geodermatophilus sp. SYSU D00965]
MDLTAHALRYFVAAAEELHFARAAARLHLTPPSLSEQIARLEKRVQAPLFVRDPRGVSLTPAGAELLPLARAVVAAHDAVADWAAGRRTAVAGTVRVGAFAASAAPLRTAVLGAAEAEHPGIRVATRRMGLDHLLAGVRDGDVDVAYVPEPMPDPLPGLRSLTVAWHRRVLVLPADHPLAARAEVSIEETNDEVFISLAETTPEGNARWLVDPRADGSSPRRGPVATDVDELLDLCAAGKGLSIAAEPVTSHYTRPGVCFVPLGDVEAARFALVWRSDERDSAVLAYVALARRVAAGRPEPVSGRRAP